MFARVAGFRSTAAAVAASRQRGISTASGAVWRQQAQLQAQRIQLPSLRRGYASPTRSTPNHPEGTKDSNASEYGAPRGTPASSTSASEQPEADAAPDSTTHHLRSPHGQGRGADGLPKSAYISSTDRKRERMATLGFASFLIMCVGGVIYLGRDWDTPEEIEAHASTAPNGFAPGLFYNRIKIRARDILEYYNQPVFEKLLPDPIPDPEYQRPYTLVLGLEDLLVHTEWDREHGWRTAKRPGLDYFLGYLSMYYELVVFSEMPSYLANPILEKLNTYPGYISHGLAREATRYKNGKYVKDLAALNRDLSKVILVDTNPDAASLQPTNAIIIPPWKGTKGDKGLFEVLNVLEFIAAMGVPDVRPVIADFGDKHIPTEFAKREAVARKKFHERLAEERAKRKEAPGGGFMSAVLGIKPTQEKEEKMLQDQVRERGQQNYLEQLKMVMSQKEKVQEEEKQRMKEMNESMKTSLSKILTEGLPKPPGA